MNNTSNEVKLVFALCEVVLQERKACCTLRDKFESTLDWNVAKNDNLEEDVNENKENNCWLQIHHLKVPDVICNACCILATFLVISPIWNFKYGHQLLL